MMFEFPRFATTDPRHAVELVRAHPFALVVSETNGVPVATHVPVIEESPVDTSFVGATLLSHMARVNPHWREFEPSPRVLVVFSGPHGYVSPTVYATDPAVPTWNYAAVHLTGTVELITDPDGTLGVVPMHFWRVNAAPRRRPARDDLGRCGRWSRYARRPGAPAPGPGSASHSSCRALWRSGSTSPRSRACSS